jgi:hypothetical protein
MNKFIILFLFTFFSCGKSIIPTSIPNPFDSGSTETPYTPVVVTFNNDSITSHFIDAPVEGLSYKIDGVFGETTTGGAFPCKLLDVVSFYINRSLFIGKALCNENIFSSQLENIGGLDPLDISSAIMTSALLLALNVNSNEDSIILPDDLADPSSEELQSNMIDIIKDNESDGDQIAAVNSILGSFGTDVTIDNQDLLDAKEHIKEEIEEYADVKYSERLTANTMAYFLADVIKNKRNTFDLDGSTTHSVQNNSAGCPNNLSGLQLSLVKVSPDAASDEFYMNLIKVERNTSDVVTKSTVLSKSRILAKRITALFDVVVGSSRINGIITLKTGDTFKGASGLISFVFPNTSNMATVPCQYTVSLK